MANLNSLTFIIDSIADSTIFLKIPKSQIFKTFQKSQIPKNPKFYPIMKIIFPNFISHHFPSVSCIYQIFGKYIVYNKIHTYILNRQI